jgi:ABC-type antimicrobial peptide transport system permease subunit
MSGVPLEDILMAFDNIRQHKLRSLLTILGVVIGTMTVIVIAAFVSGIETRVAKEIESFGTNSIYIYKFDPGFNFDVSREERMRKPISYQDYESIIRESQSISAATIFLSPVAFDAGPLTPRIPVRYQEKEMLNATVTSCLPTYFRMGTIGIEEGRFFTDAENEHRADIVVIGRDVANTLFPNISPIDKELLVDGRSFRIIGVLEKRDTFLVGDEDPNNENKSVYMPYLTLRKIYPSLKDNFVMAQAKPGELKKASEEIRQILRRQRNVKFSEKDNFGISTADEIVKQFNAITGGIFFIMLLISSVGLLIGGIGVMNIMLVSVTERTKEIGIRKAIGATKRDIILQFLVEAATLTGIGGVLGILFGCGVAELVKLIIPTFIPLWAPITGFLVSLALGVGFGLWPAWKASKLDPIETLRYE